MIKKINKDEGYVKKKALELVALDLLGDLEKSISELKSSRNQPIKRCCYEAIYDTTLRQAEAFLEICSEKKYISNHQFKRLARRYKEITGYSFEDRILSRYYDMIISDKFYQTQ